MTTAKYRQLRAAGLCTDCQVRRTSQARCTRCAASHLAHQHERRAKLRATSAVTPPVNAAAWTPTPMAERILSSLR